MPWLILGIAVVVGLFLIGRGLYGLDPKRAGRIILFIVLVIAGIAGIVALSRAGSFLYALAFVLLPLLMRWRSVLQYMRNLGGPSAGQATGVETRFLRMSLDHDSGILDGMVLDGQFRGRRLSELKPSELSELLRECRVEDEQSATVLEAYLDRTYGASWRTGEEQADDAGAEDGGNQGRRRSSPWSGSTMTRDEAYEILGLQPGATTQAIKEAHHTLMKKYHPDQGGSNYLASKINQAKELLLGE